MITYRLINNTYKYEMENCLQLFFPAEKLQLCDTDAQITISKKQSDNKFLLSVTVNFAEKKTLCDETAEEFECERILAVLLYKLLSEHTGISPLWGVQTGVRPIKLYRSHYLTQGEAGADEFFREKMLVSEEKLSVAKEINNIQASMLKRQKKRGFSLYISIPFCPSRCNYCSFISHDVAAMKKQIPEYIETVIRELEVNAQIAHRNGLELQTVYIGGGTPTAITAPELERIMQAVSDYFDTTHLLEYTVEAGRPDTVTEEKLAVIKENGATRISINPQTLSDEVLQNIGRKHTAQQFYDAYNMATSAGFDVINTDLIAGLSGDTPESFERTLTNIAALSPACVTVHTLSIKRSSNLVMNGTAVHAAQSQAVSQMLQSAQKILRDNSYKPYYLYRQSKMAGNHENIGWSKAGYECLYNVFIMEEQQTILAVGAGASTKLVADETHIERIFNYKYPYEYIRGFDEMLARKQRIDSFYKEHFAN